MTPDQIKQLAKQAGGTSYTNRHYPGDIAVAFGPTALNEFVRLVQADALEKAAEAFDKRGAPCTGYYDPHEPAEIIRSLK